MGLGIMVVVDEHAKALADAVDTALTGWVERSVRRRLHDAGRPADAAVLEAAEAAGQRAAEEVGAAVRDLLALDIDEQWTTPLSLLRGAARYPTAVLEQAGVPHVARDRIQEALLPEDVYDLAPATFADIDPSLADPGLAWGAAKAFAHLQRHGGRS